MEPSFPGIINQSCVHHPFSEGACTPCHRLSEVEIRLAEAKRVLGELTVAQCEIKSEINRTEDALLKAFPTEIICRIFELCVLPSHFQPLYLEGYSYPFPTFSPLRLGAVCKAWRNIAWSAPRLWTYIPILLNAKVFTTSAGYEMAQAWFKRSGESLPLFVRVHETASLTFKFRFRHDQNRFDHIDRVETEGCVPSMSQMAALMSLINEHSHRFAIIDLQLPGSMLKEVIKHTNTVAESLPQVITGPLMMRIHNTDSRVSRPSPAGPFRMDLSNYSAPLALRLLDLRINSLHGIKWTNLTCLFTRKAYADELLSVISNAHCLKRCISDDVQFRSDPGLPNVSRPYVHRSLCHIVFCTSSVEAVDLFGKITTPALTALFITIAPQRGRPIDAVVPCLTEFLERSESQLCHLRLDLPTSVSLSGLWDLFITLPVTLNTLELGRNFQPEIWTELFTRFGRPCRALEGRVFLPNLRDIGFYHPIPNVPSPADWGLIASTLELALLERNDPFTKNLKRIKVAFCLPSAASPGPRPPYIWQMRYGDLAKFAKLIQQHRVPFMVLGATGFYNHCYERIGLIQFKDHLGSKKPNELCTLTLKQPPAIPQFR